MKVETIHMDISKKEQHEAFVSNLTGAPIWESYSLISVSAFCLILRNLMVCLIPLLTTLKCRVVVDLSLIIIIPILSVTLLSEYHVLLSIILLLIYAFIIMINIDFTKLEIPKQAPCDVYNRARFFSELRALLMIFTCICILAVDFQSFPRKFAKTEAYGSGIMDCGVGSFVIAMGSVSACSTRSNKMRSLRANLSTILPLIVIGIGRIISLRAVDYQEHITEYGTHWNFFITLAFIKMLSMILSPLSILPYWLLAVIISICQQCLLYLGLEDYIMSENRSRSSFLSANREGVFTLPGYLALFYWGAHFGDIVYRHLKVASNNEYKVLSLKALCLHLSGTSFICGIMAYHTSPISRRVTNFGYVMWTVSFCGYLMLVLLLGDLCVSCIGKRRSSFYKASELLDLINRESLAYFLFANVSTGCVNIFINTLECSYITSICVLIAYNLIVISLVYVKSTIFNRLFNKANKKKTQS